MKVWHEMKGKCTEVEGKEVTMIKIGEEWKEMKGIIGKEIYEQLVRLRYGKPKQSEEEKERVNYAMTRKLTPQQRPYWFRVAHKKLMTKGRLSTQVRWS